MAGIVLGRVEAVAAENSDNYFDIAEQSVTTALLEFARQAEVSLLFPQKAFVDINANRLHGQYDLQDALDTLLDGTGIDAFLEMEKMHVVIQLTDETSEDDHDRRGEVMATRKASDTGNFLFTALATFFASNVPDAANAQEQSQTNSTAAEIMVTGSRIQRDGMNTATPVTALGGDELQTMAPTLLMDAVNMLPQFRNNDQSQTGGVTSSAGANSVNLRGIGGNRTLVLLNGRRVISSTKDGTVDIALFPQPLIESMEIVTGGASAAYGSDAISGVANFILDTDFTGITTSMQAGVTDRADRENVQFQLAGGTAIGERSHIVASLDYFGADDVIGYGGRDWYQSADMLTNPDPSGPERVICAPAYSLTASLGGLITDGPLQGTRFTHDGSPTQTVMGNFVSPGEGYCGGIGDDPAAQYSTLFPEEERYTGFFNWTYDFSDNGAFFIQFLKGVHSIETNNYPTAQGPWEFEIFSDNAYLPESIRQRMIDAGIESFPLGRALPDISNPRRVSKHDMRSLTTGFDFTTDNGLQFNVYYQYGETIQTINYAANNQQILLDRIYRAVDAVEDPDTGNIVCRSKITGISPEEEAALSMVGPTGVVQYGDPLSNALCTPLNIFGFGNASQEALDYVRAGNYHDQEVTQHFIEGTVQFAPFDTWAGTVSAVAGLSYREDKVYQDAFGNPPETRDVGAFATFSDEVVGYKGIASTVISEEYYLFGNPNADNLPIQGGFDVKEAFGEFYVPLYRGASTAFIDMNLAARYADYSGSGEVWAGKLGLDWQVSNDVRLRATVSRDTRAGTLSERYDQQGGGGTIDDPFNPELAPYVTSVFEGGNPEINPEIAETVTYGLVYQPSWLEGLGVSLDYYDITLKDAISQLSLQDLVDECFAGAQELCDRIFFAADGKIQDVFNYFVNVAEAHTTGVDLEIRYDRPIALFGGNESIRLRGFVNYLTEVSEQNVGAPKQDRAGNIDIPELVATLSLTYSRDNLDIFLQQRYTGDTVRDVRWRSGIDINDNKVGSMTYTDMNLSYTLDAPNGGDMRIYANINNLFDKDPVILPDAGRFDILGRRYVLGMEYSF